MQRAIKRGRVRADGRWPALWAAIGIEPPEAKTARAALAKLAEHGIVTRVSGQRWRLDPAASEPTGATAATVQGPDPKRTSDASPDQPGVRCRDGRDAGSPHPRPRARRDLDPARRRVPLWLAEPHPLVPKLVASIEQAGVLGVAEATAVTLTVAPGADLDATGRAFGERFAGLFRGAWLVPETSPGGLRHYHGLVIGNRAEIIGGWQRCGGGIARAQRLDPLDPGDHEHLLRAVAYAMKRRHVEHGEVIASGVLASPGSDDSDQWPGSDDTDQWPGSDDRDQWPGTDDSDQWPGSDDRDLDQRPVDDDRDLDQRLVADTGRLEPLGPLGGSESTT